MSEIEYHRGIVKEIETGDETPEQTAKRILNELHIKIAKYHDTALKCFEENAVGFFYHPRTNKFYHILDKELQPYDDSLIANRKDKTTIEYELRFYNGGAGFEECLEAALDILDKRECEI